MSQLLRISFLVVVPLLLLCSLQVAAQGVTQQQCLQQQPTPRTYDPASTSLVFQLRTWRPPTVPFADYYTAAGANARGGNIFCQIIGPHIPNGNVVSFEAMRRALATTAGVPLEWLYVFPQDEYISKFSAPSCTGWQVGGNYNNVSSSPPSSPPTPAPTPLPSTVENASSTTATSSSTTTTTATSSTTTSTTTGGATATSAPTTPAPTTSAPPSSEVIQPRGFMSHATSQVYAVWVLVKQTSSNGTAIPDADRQSSNSKLLKIATNVAGGDSTSLAAAAGPTFFALAAMDFGTAVNVAPMGQQKQALRVEWLAVYDAEWDRFLVGMIATTILGTAAYITAHCFIHRVKIPVGGIATAEVPAASSASASSKSTKNAADSKQASAAAAAAAAAASSSGGGGGGGKMGTTMSASDHSGKMGNAAMSASDSMEEPMRYIPNGENVPVPPAAIPVDRPPQGSIN